MKNSFSVILNTTNDNINNKNNNNSFLSNFISINNIDKKDDLSPSKILNILKNYSQKEKNIFFKNLKKPRKISEKYIPKEKILKSYININYSNTEKKGQDENINKINKGNIKLIPIKNRMLYIQKKIEKNNHIIKSLSEENRLFHNRYKKASIFQKKNKNRKNLIELEENFKNEDNVFNKSILLSKEDTDINDILGETDIKECKEDLNIIENIKKNYNEAKNIEYPFHLLDNIKKFEEKKKINISKIKREIEETKKTIKDLEKNRNNFDDFDLDRDKRLALEKLRKKIMQINTNKENRNYNIYNNSFLDNKGTYKLVTKCNISNNNNDNNLLNFKRKISRSSSIKFRLFNFYNEYNRVKRLMGPTSKSKNCSAKFVIDKENEYKKKIFEKKVNLDEVKYFNTLSLSLDSNNNKENKSFDINNLYTYMKYNKYDKAKHLFLDYIKKYNKKYDLNINKRNGMKLYPILAETKQNSVKYNVYNKMANLNNNKYIDLNLFKNEKRKLILKKIKRLDEKMKNVGFDTTENIQTKDQKYNENNYNHEILKKIFFNSSSLKYKGFISLIRSLSFISLYFK